MFIVLQKYYNFPTYKNKRAQIYLLDTLFLSVFIKLLNYNIKLVVLGGAPCKVLCQARDSEHG